MPNAIANVQKLIKRQPSLRQQLSSISKSEQEGEPGAKDAREHLTANLAKDVAHAERSIEETRDRADAAERLSLALRHRSLPQHPLTRSCHLLGVPAPRLAGLTALADHTARKCADIATSARDRLDDAEPVVRSTAILAAFLAQLPSHGFNKKHPALQSLRRELHDAQTLSKKATR